MLVHNEAPSSLTVPFPAKIQMAPGSTEALPKVQILGYTGAAVDLTDMGVDAPVVYLIDGIELAKPNGVPYLLNHDPNRVLGHVESFSKTKNSVSVSAIHSYPSQESRDVAAAIQNGLPYEASMGLEIDLRTTVFHPEGQVEANGRVFNAPIYTVGKSKVNEMSATLSGRDGATAITKLSKEALMKIRNASPTPTDEPSQPDKDDKDTTPVQPKAEPGKPVTAEPPGDQADPDDDNDTAPVNNSRPRTPVNGGMPEMVLNALDWALEYPNEKELVRNAVRQGWDKDRLDREVKLSRIENSYPELPGAFRANPKASNAFAARMALAVGVSPEFLETQGFDKKTIDVANNQPRLGLKEALMLTANANGGAFNGHSDVHNLCKHLKAVKNANAFSTIDFPNLMHQVSNWKLEEAWKIGEPFAPRFAMSLSNKDFRETNHIRPGGGTMWNGLNKEQKIDHGSFGKEETYSTKLSTVAQILTFPREDIINDNIGWIETVLDLMVEGALMVPDYQLTNLIYNATEAGMLEAGVTSFTLPLTRDNLRTVYNAVKRTSIQKGSKEVKAQQSTRWTLVIADGLEETAWEILNQTKFVQGPTGEYVGEGNFWAKKFDVQVFQQLDNVTYHSAAKEGAWGLVPTATRVAPFAITYLNGMRRPTMETVDLPADELGFGVRGYWDVNVGYRPVADNKLQATAWSFPPNA